MVSLDSLRDYQKLLFDNFNSTSIQGLFALTTSVENGLTNADQPKPQHSYIGLIAMAILSSPDRKMILSEVYDWIAHHYPYFRSRGSGWRNSIRHNLSLNDCFVKAGRAANGKGHYWAIHPANLRDFERGDFRRRRAQRKVRRHMGLSVPEGESSDESPSTSPRPPLVEQQNNVNHLFPLSNPLFNLSHFRFPFLINETFEQSNEKKPRNRRNFTIDSILSDAI